MGRQKRWQFLLIITVLILTVYNILPTLFYYARPLKKPIDEPQANTTALSIIKRTNNLETEAVDWLDAFCKQLKLSPLAISLDKSQPQFIAVSFKTVEEATQLREHLPRAGALIPFTPSQLSLASEPDAEASRTVLVRRRIPVHFDPEQIDAFYQFSPKIDQQGQITDLYRALVNDRVLQLGTTLGGPSENALLLKAALMHPQTPQSQEIFLSLSQKILSFVHIFGENSSTAQKYFASFSQIDAQDRATLPHHFVNALNALKDRLKLEKIALQEENQARQQEGGFLTIEKTERLETLVRQEATLQSAEEIVKRHLQAFSAGNLPFDLVTFSQELHQSSANQTDTAPSTLLISLADRNPFIASITVDWLNEKIYLTPHTDLQLIRQQAAHHETSAQYKQQLEQFLYNTLANLSRQSGETILPLRDEFAISLNKLQESKSFLAMRLATIADAQETQLKETLLTTWNPKHPDFQKEIFPIWNYEEYTQLPLEEQKLGLIIYSPSTLTQIPPKGFRMNSIYVIAKGLDKILQKAQKNPAHESSQLVLEDFSKLQQILQTNGYMGYSGKNYLLDPQFANDFIFENEDYFQDVLSASREDFTVHGTKRYAVLEFTDLEQRILTKNKIETHIHEDLLKWRDDYRSAQLNIKGASALDVPPPTKNVYWNNFQLSFLKYFRGDDRKVLHWGLDLSGGKTVQIELRDQNNKLVKEENEIRQAINELYTRVNKMGVSEVSIRQEGNYITLDFPGSQGLTASELIKASSMYFHIVNEKFTPGNPALSDSVHQFLQEIWNEAVITNKKTSEEINLIAWQHLNGESQAPDVSAAAKILYENGLRLANPQEMTSSSYFNDALSKVALLRGEDFTNWQGQTHPLIIVFRNYALEGSNLDEVHAAYDPSKGNYLAFKVKGAHRGTEGEKLNPQDELYAWTSQFAKEKIEGTPNENYSHGRGWRMAVILNGTIVSSPTLDSALRDSAMISGSFSQREANQLEADLKAGSLSFTPRILSEKNVSPELGTQERTLGIVAMILALVLVIAAMIGYYRFAGLIACIALLINLMIMWATLQNLQATLTLATIAGIILTLGMAVDANVLVFERVREEFAQTGRIATAIQTGYKKAFSAIIDSNLTTIIAALILLNFDSGPIKGFAVTLIIGIVSSMFTALFLTRYFFSSWVQNPKNKVLHMRNFLQAKFFDFLKYSKSTIVVSTMIILVGCFFSITERNSMIGMDFTGGYALNLEIEPQHEGGYRQKVEQALLAKGITSQEFQIRELTPSNNIRLFLSKNLTQKGRPFFGMPVETEAPSSQYSYQTHPKMVWVVEALQQSGLPLTSQSLVHLEKNWTEVSGQMSTTMRNNALLGLLLALLCIMVYITFRFEFKYAISATICLAHDLIFTIAAMAILHACGVAVQIDLITITALMTIIGYSLNDTIIVFDRIREDMRLMRKAPFTEIINHALNATLSRTLMTSGTTLLVLIPLVALGGSTIFGFALVMMIGIIFGTLSSLFIAAPLLQYFHKRENVAVIK